MAWEYVCFPKYICDLDLHAWRGYGQNEVYVANLHGSLGRLASALEKSEKRIQTNTRQTLKLTTLTNEAITSMPITQVGLRTDPNGTPK